MRKICFLMLVLFFLAIAQGLCLANNVELDNVVLQNINTGAKTYEIKFDISWENSWRVTGATPATTNWDAAWIFAKYSVYDDDTETWSDWAHCSLSSYTAPAGATMDFGATSAVNKGVFMYRSAAGSGDIDWENAVIKWLYTEDFTAETIVQIKLFAIEMVYIPTASFWVGDVEPGGPTGQFYEYNTSTPRDPYKIESEEAINIGEEEGNLWATGNRGDIVIGETLLAAFPKGYNAFYIMKYEISQQQYVEFLNTLTRTQQNTRTASQTANQYAMSNNVGVIARNGIRNPATIPSGSITFGCDLNGNGIFNEDDDGQWIACNYLSWGDIAAYACWATLRPFTELEFEKAARGGQTVVANEYAWGTTDITQASITINNSGTESETVDNSGNGLCQYNRSNGPLRCGFAATGSTGRAGAGASYYGVMELSGNIRETIVSITTAERRGFTGSHGDGTLTLPADWPSSTGFRGGDWITDATRTRTADRLFAAYAATDRDRDCGGRLARIAP
jgi:formylglycine-generating enzyme required for sulfatase activity